MTQTKFCPLCQHRNKIDAVQCEKCGITLTIHDEGLITTIQVAKLDSAIAEKSTHCSDYLPNLPAHALALFFKDASQPVVVQNVNKVILGRPDAYMPEEVVDLTEFNGIELGVSRRHAQLSLANGTCTLLDLGSTNGTWVNGDRLIPGKPQKVRSSDRIWLAQLKLTVCFHTQQLGEGQLLLHHRGEAASPLFTPDYLATAVIPYLQALGHLQHTLQDIQEQPPSNIQLRLIRLSDEKGVIHINLGAAAKALEIVHKWIVPWQKRYLAKVQAEEAPADSILQSDLNQLALSILTDLVPSHTSEDRLAYKESLLPSLTILATSPLAPGDE